MHTNVRLEVVENYKAMSQRAGQIFSEKIKEYPQGAYGFATGSTPVGMYQELIRLHKEEGLDFSGIATFNLDEYHPMDRKSEHSYYHFMQHNLFAHVNANKARTFFMDGKAKNPAAEAQKYEAKIEECGGIVMQILGMGLNGHIGFNEPSDSFEPNARLVNIADITIETNSQYFDNPEDVPRCAITLGIRNIMMAKHLILLVSGGNKAAILRDALKGPITPLVPGSILQLHPSVTVVADKEAAALL